SPEGWTPGSLDERAACFFCPTCAPRAGARGGHVSRTLILALCFFVVATLGGCGSETKDTTEGNGGSGASTAPNGGAGGTGAEGGAGGTTTTSIMTCGQEGPCDPMLGPCVTGQWGCDDQNQPLCIAMNVPDGTSCGADLICKQGDCVPTNCGGL